MVEPECRPISHLDERILAAIRPGGVCMDDLVRALQRDPVHLAVRLRLLRARGMVRTVRKSRLHYTYLLADDPADPQPRLRGRRVLEEIERLGPVSVATVSARLNQPVGGALHYYVQDHLRAGYITRTKAGRAYMFSITPEGRKALVEDAQRGR